MRDSSHPIGFARRLLTVTVAATFLATTTAHAFQSTRRTRTSGANQAARATARWIGQDGEDRVGPSREIKPSGVQDIRIKLAGLPAGLAVDYMIIQGHGGDEWQVGDKSGSWGGLLLRPGEGATADLLLEPTRVETGREFTIKIAYADGRRDELIVRGGKADPARRVASAALRAEWIGQTTVDRAGDGPSVGPDGFVDVQINLANAPREVEVRALSVTAPDGKVWEFGVNPRGHTSAELLRGKSSDDPHQLFLQLDSDRAGQTLTIAAEYANGTKDSAKLVAGKSARTPVAVPKLAALNPATFKAQLTAPRAQSFVTPYRLSITGLPRSPVVAAVLSNATGAIWVAKSRDDIAVDAGGYSRSLAWRTDGPGRATAEFAPVRDESGSQLLLRLLFADGSSQLAIIEGVTTAPRNGLAQSPAKPRLIKPNANLHAEAKTGGKLRLAAGTYRLDQPLVIERATMITAEPGATLIFAQPQNAGVWTAAIKIHASDTTLDGLRIRFEGPVRWDRDVSFGPAVIGTTDNRDQGFDDPKHGIVLTNLDVEMPVPSSDREEAPRLMRLVSARDGRIEGCKLRGGKIELNGGPWHIIKNEHLGTPERSYVFSVISAHYTQDLLVADNTTRAVAPSGKVWRFLVLTQRGDNAVVRNNTIADIGPRDSDTVHENAPEIILTESYRQRFEGRPLAISPDGRLLAISQPQGHPAEPGDVVAILAGKNAGQWRRVAQRINATTYLIDPPLPTDGSIDALSIAAGGFVNSSFEGNKIDARAGKEAAGFVLAGHLYGTRVVNNTITGNGEAFRIVASPTEEPVHWGWSHTSVLDLEFAGNRIEGAGKGALLSVEHGTPVKTNSGRLYFTANVRDNVLAIDPSPTASNQHPRIIIGDRRALDPAEMRLTTSGNQIAGAPKAAVFQVNSGVVDGVATNPTRSVDRPATSRRR